MTDVDTADLLELRFMLESSIDVQFQAWMAISFAVIVASYSGRADLNRIVRIAVVLVYLVTVYALFARWMTEAGRIGEIAEVLRSRGIFMEPIMGSGQTRFTAYISGTIVTAISVFYFGRMGNSRSESSQHDES